jgi:glycosyltransferase involved in cell wall biosynthesis
MRAHAVTTAMSYTVQTYGERLIAALNRARPGLSGSKAGAIGERRWIICQIGAREHYALAAELKARDRLAALLTDVWARPGSLFRGVAPALGAAGKRARERYTIALEGARIVSEGPISFGFRALRAGIVTHSQWSWPGILSINRWFDAWAARQLERSGILHDGPQGKPVVFAYSYAALEIFRVARRAGCLTVLGQIDPGPTENKVVADVAKRHGFEMRNYELPPTSYWENWREECALAELIVVNSQWSVEALAQAGIDRSKIRVVPLAYRMEADEGRAHPHQYPATFTPTRPLRLLFLGQVNLRKGAAELLQAMALLAGAPVHLVLVGAVQNDLRQRFAAVPQVEWIGAVSRGEVGTYYRNADVFILPTHSDGFALTQLEAQVYGLPVFASQRCGDVVLDGVNGRLIDPIAPETIAALVRWAIAHPHLLEIMSGHAIGRATHFTSSRTVDAMVEALSSLTVHS